MDSLHRVAKKVLDPTLAAGKELREWLADATGQVLEDFPHAFMILQEYALVPLVERRIESVHAIIKRILRKVTYILPASLCAFTREGYNIDMLNHDPEFMAFCLSEWRKRGLYDNLLKNLRTPEQLKDMSNVDKLKFIYQYSMEQDFMSTDDARVQHAQFEQIVAHARPQPPAQPADISLLVFYLKELFRRGDVLQPAEGCFRGLDANGGFG